ncbi:3'-5' exonuclease [Ferrovum sp.]|uniref:3'-5' exonuclease n=1 Tax=Ferrovum sp. TaxID=2609467 RepID=UPI00261E3204|nr:3'-5' exonuclease [Ferrovum sp.]
MRTLITAPPPAMITNPETLVQALSDHPDYRVLRRLKARTQLAPATGHPLHRGVIVDTETTGLDARKDKIIEIGMIVFDYDPVTGQPIQVRETYGGLEDPGFPLSPETVRLTGITDALVAGQRFDDAALTALLSGTQLVIAHNAAFDRPFLEKRLPVFSDLPWGCSMMDIDWEAEGISSRKLDYLAFRQGFFFDAHRAEGDCQALLEILALPLPLSTQPGLKPILDRLPQKSYAVSALNSPFSTKDLLKERQYRWNGERKCWVRTLENETALKEEMEWLKTASYGGKTATVEIDERNARTRFSFRAGNTRHCVL